MEGVDLGAARQAVCAWLDEHHDGTLAQMADDIKRRYPAHPEEMAIVLRGMMAAELRRRTRPVPVSGDGKLLRAVTEGLPPRRDAVARLHRFQGEYPDVQFTSPVMGRYGQYTALVPPGVIPGDPREIIVRSADLCGLMDALADLFGSPGTG